jgi:type I restriction enzyme, R subunit
VDDELKPYRETVEERFQAWLLKQQQAGADFTEQQLRWLETIRDVVASDVGISPAEFNAEPFKGMGGGRGFQRAFPGRDVRSLLSELNRELEDYSKPRGDLVGVIVGGGIGPLGVACEVS